LSREEPVVPFGDERSVEELAREVPVAKSKPLIVVANDDGVFSPGLLALKQALEDVGEVVVIAPDRNWTAAGHSKTMHKPLRVSRVTLADGSAAFAGSGSPSDCVALALLGLLKRQPDLIVSGINHGPNVGHDLTYSGTVAAAIEGAIFEVPAIAVSLDTYEKPLPAAVEMAARFAADLARRVLERGLPKGVLLNVNVPNLPPEEVRGVDVTRMGTRVYRDELIERLDPRGRPYYWIGGEAPTGEPLEGTDFGAIHRGAISVTPIHLDLTEYRLLDELADWKLAIERGAEARKEQKGF
jgi:5'-nucleotidase